MSRVALVGCASYDPGDVAAAVARLVDLLGGIERFVRPGETILLKPNLLFGRSPERAVTTHPSVFRAVAEIAQRGGAIVEYGDSPGFGRPEAAARHAGLLQVAEELGVRLADFETPETVSNPRGRLVKQFTLARGVLAADGLISLPKMKTHGLTRITGAIKNQYGCIPGFLKAEFHGRLTDVDLFSQMLVDLNLLLRPRLVILDGIVAMEGNGPGHGRPRPMNVLIGSEDPVAVDATVCRLIDLDPQLVPPIVHGEAAGLGTASDIEVVGDPATQFASADFDVYRAVRPTSGTFSGRRRWVRVVQRLLVARPIIRAARCTRCGACIEVCPVTPKAIAFTHAKRLAPPTHHYERCIRCYCCQELCPAGAIEIAVPWPGRLIRRSVRRGAHRVRRS